MGPAGSRTRWRLFLAAAGAGLVATGAFTAVMLANPWGARVTTAVDDTGEAAAALIAALACAWAARNAKGRLRRGWMLLSAATLAWCLGQVVWTVYEVVLNATVPSPSVADAGFLAAIPLVIAAIVQMTDEPRDTATRGRLWLDSAIVALSLIFIDWALGLNEALRAPQDAGGLVSLAYPLGDVVILTTLILAIRRATDQNHGRFLLLLAGLGAIAVSDTAFAVLTASGGIDQIGSVLDSGWVIGFLEIALAAMWPMNNAPSVRSRAPIDLWQIAMPWIAIIAASLVGLYRVALGIPMDIFLSVTVAAIAFLVALSQVLTHRDSLTLIVQARRSEATLAEVISNAPTAILLIDNDLMIRSFNKRFKTMMRATDDAQLQGHISGFLDTGEENRAEGFLATLRTGVEDLIEVDGHARRVDGGELWVRCNATAVRGPNGLTDYFIAMMEDTTAKHAQEQAVAANLELFQRLSHIKSEFLQSVRHEFKTALTGIQGFAEYMRDSDELNLDDVRTFAADIHKDAERLDRLIEEMLDLDRVETSRAVLNLGAVDLNAVVRAQVEDARRGVDGITIELTLDPAVGQIAGDGEKVGQAVRELVRNAVRYSPDGGRVWVATSLQSGDIDVSVRDQGIAKRSDFDTRIFADDDLYANSPIRKIVGAGLGMGIVREIAELHGGRLWVNRVDGQGSEIHFVLPALVPHRRQDAVA